MRALGLCPPHSPALALVVRAGVRLVLTGNQSECRRPGVIPGRCVAASLSSSAPQGAARAAHSGHHHTRRNTRTRTHTHTHRGVGEHGGCRKPDCWRAPVVEHVRSATRRGVIDHRCAPTFGPRCSARLDLGESGGEWMEDACVRMRKTFVSSTGCGENDLGRGSRIGGRDWPPCAGRKVRSLPGPENARPRRAQGWVGTQTC